jgi:hypothetical protein
MYALGHVRPKNRKEDRVDRRLPENQSPDRVVVMAIRERRARGKSISRITRGENADCAWEMVRKHVAQDAHIFADERSCRAVRPTSSFGSASNRRPDRSSKPVRRSASSAMRARATSIGSSGNVMRPTVSTLLLLDEAEVRASRLVNALLRSCA